MDKNINLFRSLELLTSGAGSKSLPGCLQIRYDDMSSVIFHSSSIKCLQLMWDCDIPTYNGHVQCIQSLKWSHHKIGRIEECNLPMFNADSSAGSRYPFEMIKLSEKFGD